MDADLDGEEAIVFDECGAVRDEAAVEVEAVRAARECRIPIIVIARPEEDGLSFDEVLAVCREKMK